MRVESLEFRRIHLLFDILGNTGCLFFTVLVLWHVNWD